MKLDEFITQTLIAIMQGVENAQKQVTESGGVVNPHIWKVPEKHLTAIPFGHQNQPITDVTFDVVVTTSEKAETKGVFVRPTVENSKGNSSAPEGSESRIQFKVGLILPYKSMA